MRKHPDPPNQGIQSYLLFGDLEIQRSEILRKNIFMLSFVKRMNEKKKGAGDEVSA